MKIAEILEIFSGGHRNLLNKSPLIHAEFKSFLFRVSSRHTLPEQQLVGAYFLHEYSFEAAALLNPSIVAHPDQMPAPAKGRSALRS